MSVLNRAGEQLEGSSSEETHRRAIRRSGATEARAAALALPRVLGRRRSRLRVAGATTLLVVLAVAVVLPRQNIHIAVDGGSLTIRSRSHDEDTLANQAGIALQSGDSVERVSGNDLAVRRAIQASIDVDGVALQLATQAETVADLIQEAGIQLSSEDSVYRDNDLVSGEAPLMSSRAFGTLEGDAVQLEIRRAVPYTIVENGHELQLRSSRATLASALSEAGVRVGPGDAVQPALSTDMTSGLEVYVDHARPLVVTMPEGKVMLYTLAETIGDAVSDGSLTLPDDYRIEPSPEAEIGAGLAVHVIGISEEQIGETERIESRTIYEPDPTLPYGQQRVVEGQDGILHRAYEVTYEDSQQVGRELAAEWYDPEPADTIVYYSTASAPVAPPVAAAANVGDWSDLVCSYDWDCAWALAVIRCESGGNANAYNPGGYVGLFQIWEGHGANLTDPATNIAAAYSLYASGGASHWPNCP